MITVLKVALELKVIAGRYEDCLIIGDHQLFDPLSPTLTGALGS